MTKAQHRMLQRAAESRLGVVEFDGFGLGVGWMRASFNKCGAALVARGLMKPYVHGGYEITEAGREALLHEKALGGT